MDGEERTTPVVRQARE